MATVCPQSTSDLDEVSFHNYDTLTHSYAIVKDARTPGQNMLKNKQKE